MQFQLKLNSKMVPKRGLLKLTICQAILNQHCQAGTLSLKIDEQTRYQDMKFNDKKTEIWDFFMYGISPNAKITISLVLSNKKVGWAEFPLQKICAIPKVCHQVDIILVEYNEDLKQVKVPLAQIGSINIQFLFITNYIGKLYLSMIQAELTRNTELVGQMDPYVVLQIDGISSKTGVKDQQGKHPIWNQKFEFQINNVDAILKLTVFDKDGIQDDIVGGKQINLLKQGFLIPRKHLKSLPVSIIYNDQNAGILNIQYRFELTGQ